MKSFVFVAGWTLNYLFTTGQQMATDGRAKRRNPYDNQTIISKERFAIKAFYGIARSTDLARNESIDDCSGTGAQ